MASKSASVPLSQASAEQHAVDERACLVERVVRDTALRSQLAKRLCVSIMYAPL